MRSCDQVDEWKLLHMCSCEPAVRKFHVVSTVPSITNVFPNMLNLRFFSQVNYGAPDPELQPNST